MECLPCITCNHLLSVYHVPVLCEKYIMANQPSKPCIMSHLKLWRMRFREGSEFPSCQVVRGELITEPRSVSLLLPAASTVFLLAKLGRRPEPVNFWACISSDSPQPSTSLIKGSAAARKVSWQVSSSLSFTWHNPPQVDNIIHATQHQAWPLLVDPWLVPECRLYTWKL